LTFLQAFRRAALAIVTDVGPFMPAIGAVVLYCALYPLPYLPQAVRDIPVAVADADGSPLSRELARNLDATREIETAAITRTVEEALPLLHSGRIGGIVSIPEHFDRDVRRGTATGVTVMGNGGFIVLDGALLAAAGKATGATVAPALAANLARAGVPGASLQASARAAPLIVKQPLFNMVEGYESYVVSASIGLIIMQLLTIAIATVVGTWCERGEWPVAPGGRLSAAAYAGMIAGFSAFALAAALFWIGFVFWYHDLPRAGNPGGAIAFAALYAVVIAAYAVALGAWMAERERAFQFIAAVSIPLLFFSGFAFPVESFVEPVRWLSLVFPSTPGIRGFIALNQMGASLEEAAPQVLHLAILAAVFLACAWLAASWRARGPKLAPHELQSARTITQDGPHGAAHDGLES